MKQTQKPRCKSKLSMHILIGSAVLFSFVASLSACRAANTPSQLTGTRSVTTMGASLRFGPEFEFNKRNKYLATTVLRSMIFSKAIRKFSGHLKIDPQISFPDAWLYQNPEFAMAQFKKSIEFEGKLTFASIPEHWPADLQSVFIDTGALYGSSADLKKDPPIIRLHFSAGQELLLSYGVDDVFLEAHVNPLTVQQSNYYAPIIDDLIFGMTATSTAPIAVPAEGGGHIHIDLSRMLTYPEAENLNDGLLLLRNFIVDFYAHSQLISYGFRADPTWALTLGMTSQEQHALFARRIEKIDTIIANRSFDRMNEATEFVLTEFRRLNVLVPLASIRSGDFSSLSFPPSIGIAKPALRISKQHKTIEIRALQAQHSYQEYIDFTNLFRGRLRYLRNLNTPIPMPSWDSIRIDPHEFKSHNISLETTKKLSIQSSGYIKESIGFLSDEESHGLRSRLTTYIRRSLTRFTCD